MTEFPKQSGTERAWRRVCVTGSWLPDHAFVWAYWNGTMWNGFAVPMFTSQDACNLCAVMPSLVYVEARQAFLFEEGGETEWFHAAAQLVDGELLQLYSLGESWCWQLVDLSEVAI
ncbi:hypothetical protein CBM2626_U50017 [Cupriavidus taiwanensis]|uniref:Uncharacterized protein n=1 Tax=Cupriavidus taiwanensis TaxID=164546 RepID=A0A375EI04_9BURK|nr:hypothetical protein [Cupriavidus taiwanensis]SOZ73606.1 hypothetical protein CBM2614_U50010 [Cupriavidus taiwanensis]SOZ73926.1 hypothetical protein CBM2615_U40018 [Cupriavidus taiwanensis]SOZ75403.1 hypothetical protein CBM2613_U40019 [Cupriavidus taiwanensis]SPA03913.1 hypothetical protein CBM2626_U50017 [Cupriavidus taiwanensis]SPA12888.1 hypothetical protein CBM2625_U50021 [Cupriavidus taiwanensis]